MDRTLISTRQLLLAMVVNASVLGGGGGGSSSSGPPARFRLLLLALLALVYCSPAEAGLRSAMRHGWRALSGASDADAVVHAPIGWRLHVPHGGGTAQCRHAGVTYVSSELEELWLNNIQEWQTQYCTQHVKQKRSINALARAVEAVDRSPTPVE